MTDERAFNAQDTLEEIKDEEEISKPAENKSDFILHIRYKKPVEMNGWKSETDTITFNTEDELHNYIKGNAAYDYLDNSVKRTDNEILLYALNQDTGEIIWEAPKNEKRNNREQHGDAGNHKKFADEDIEYARSADLCDLLTTMGYTVVRKGRYHSLKEYDSVRIYNRRSWCRWSNNTGGNAIDWMMKMEGRSFTEAMEYLCQDKIRDYIPKVWVQNENPDKEYKEMVLPPKSRDFKRLYAYLIRTRNLSKDTVDFFVRRNLLYESADYHNVVFLGRDKEGNIKWAGMRGTNDSKVFKGDVPGNNKNYGFNIWNASSDTLYVFEGAIDMMSYIDLQHNYKDNFISLAMLSEHPLDTFLAEHPNIKNICFGLDNDSHGIEAQERLKDKYAKAGYNVRDNRAPSQYKDWNEYKKSIPAALIR